MQIQIVNGVYSESQGVDYRTAYPVNLVPVPKSTGISAGYLRTAEGLTRFDTAAEIAGGDMGGINWNGKYYRVAANQLQYVAATGSVSTVASITASTYVSMTYGFDRLAVVADGRMYYVKNDGTFLQVTDGDLGTPIDVTWIDGYFAFTDGVSIGVTELNDPTSINPLKYGSSEADPDAITGVVNYRDQLVALNRYTIETFDNQGGDNFPFIRIDGAIIEKGALSKSTWLATGDGIFFLGSGRNEPISIYLGSGGSTQPIASREIDQLIQQYTEAQLSKVKVEYVQDKQNRHMYFHFPDITAVYDLQASIALEQPVWFYLSSGADRGQYTARSFVYCYDRWLCGDVATTRIGQRDETVSTQYGAVAGWQFQTPIVFNDNQPFIINNLELVGLQGRVPLNANPTVFASSSDDGGLIWSNERLLAAGRTGAYRNRLASRQWGRCLQQRIMRFRGADNSPAAWSFLHVDAEALSGW